MIELLEGDIRNNGRKSSKGNQLKWEKNHVWYKTDYTGYEGLAEYAVSHLLRFSNLKPEEYVLYQTEQIVYKKKIYNGVSSRNFLKDDWQIITLERLFQNWYGQSLSKSVWSMENVEERLHFLVNQVERITGLSEFGIYMNKVLTIDAFFLNEDRHMHNLAVLMNGAGEYSLCPIFDNGAALLADTTLDYPMGEDIRKLIPEVKGKTVSTDFLEQLDASEQLYGRHLNFNFTKKDVEHLLALDGTDSEVQSYSPEIRIRVRDILFEQMRRYQYLF